MSSTCLQCGREFSRLRLALHWPTSITCGHCRARHAYTYGHLIGLAFLAVLLPACLLPMIVAGYFMQVEGQIHSIGPMYGGSAEHACTDDRWTLPGAREPVETLRQVARCGQTKGLDGCC